ncbi:hypothetical protein Tco_1521285, partial [Tanacetum coccineum]
PRVYKKALDRTITSAKLERKKAMSPLQLSNRMNVLTSRLVSHGTKINVWYTSLTSFTTQLQKKVWIKMDQLDKLRSEFYNLKGKNEKAQEECHDQLVEAEATAAMSADELKYKDMATAIEQHFGDLESDVTRFVSFNFNCLVRKLLSSDEFNAILAHIFSLGINLIVERGVRMDRSDVQFQEALQRVSNFVLGAKAEFDKVVADLRSTSFPFLVNISKAARNTLLEVANLQPDKLARPAASSSTLATSSLISKKFGWTSAPKDFEPKGFADEADPSRA